MLWHLFSRNSYAILVLFFITLLDWLSFGLIFPLLAHLFNDPVGGILPASVSSSNRVLLLSALFTIYPAAQFFAAPILGALSDRIGRRPILILAFVGNTIGYCIAAFAIFTRSIELLFFGYLISGLTGANVAVTYSSVADMSQPHEKSRSFAAISLALGLGFILGPYFSGWLSIEYRQIPFCQNNSYLPSFLLATLFELLNVFAVGLFFKETLKERRVTRLSPWTGIVNISRAFGNQRLRLLYTIVFLFTLGWTSYSKFFPIYLIDRFSITPSEIGMLYTYFGCWNAFAQGVIVQFLAPKFSSVKILQWSSGILWVLLPLLLLSPSLTGLYLLLPAIVIAQALLLTNSSAIISNAVPSSLQGRSLGLVQSVQSFSKLIAPILGGSVAALNTSCPVILGSFIIGTGWVLLLWQIHHLHKMERKELELLAKAHSSQQSPH